MRNVIGLLAGCTLLLASPLAAQENRAWPERTFVTIDVPFQPLNNDFSESLSFADTLRKRENVTFVAGYESIRGALFDVGAGIRLMNHIGVGVTTSWFQHSGSGAFDLKVPNPLVANKPLDLTGTVSGLKRNELGIHIQALYAVALGKRTRVLLAGGPSIFQTKQGLVRSIEFDTLPGFTSLEFDQALITDVKKTAVGFNVSADITPDTHGLPGNQSSRIPECRSEPADRDSEHRAHVRVPRPQPRHGGVATGNDRHPMT